MAKRQAKRSAMSTFLKTEWDKQLALCDRSKEMTGAEGKPGGLAATLRRKPRRRQPADDALGASASAPSLRMVGNSIIG